jgi:hypothetical protein
MASWKVAPSLAAGNTVVLKPDQLHLVVRRGNHRGVQRGQLDAHRPTGDLRTRPVRHQGPEQKRRSKLANNSTYGLGGGVWSTNPERAHRVAAATRTGTVWTNDYHQITPGQPLGGYKQSGVGRELSEIGFDEYRQGQTQLAEHRYGPQRLRLPGHAVAEHLTCTGSR